MFREYNTELGMDTVIKHICSDFNVGIDKIQYDLELKFYGHHFSNIESGNKTCTIRFAPGLIRVPYDPDEVPILPCVETSPKNPAYRKPRGNMAIDNVLVAHVDDFPIEEAIRDGFTSVKDLVAAMERIYKCDILPKDILSRYSFKKYTP